MMVQSNLGGLSSLVGLAGINLNNVSENSLNPEIYPQITGSIPFIIEILNKEVYFVTLDTTISTFDYFNYFYRPSLLEYTMQYTILLPFTLK